MPERRTAFDHFARGIETGISLRRAIQGTQKFLQDRADKAAAEQVAQGTVNELKLIDAPFEAAREQIRQYNADVSDGKIARDPQREVQLGKEHARLQREKSFDRVHYFMNTLSANSANPYVVEAMQLQLHNETLVMQRLDMQAARADQMAENLRRDVAASVEAEKERTSKMERIEAAGAEQRRSAQFSSELRAEEMERGKEINLELIRERAQSKAKSGKSGQRLGESYVDALGKAEADSRSRLTEQFGAVETLEENAEFQRVYSQYAEAAKAAGQAPPSYTAVFNDLVNADVERRMGAAFPELAGQRPVEQPEAQPEEPGRADVTEDPVLRDFLNAGVITEQEHQEAQDESAFEQIQNRQSEVERVYGEGSFMQDVQEGVGAFVGKTKEALQTVYGEGSPEEKRWEKLRQKRTQIEKYQKSLAQAKKRLDDELFGKEKE